MKIEFIYNDDEKRVGYKLIAETEDDFSKLGAIRDMIFFGMDEKEIVYDGREMTLCGESIQVLRWCTREHQKKDDRRI